MREKVDISNQQSTHIVLSLSFQHCTNGFKVLSICVFDECVIQIKEHNNQQENKIETERETHFTSLQCECEFEFHKSKQTQFEKIEIERRLREGIQDVDWDLCSNTFSSIVQVSLDILEGSLVSILHL
jgi:hypothetical protein